MKIDLWEQKLYVVLFTRDQTDSYALGYFISKIKDPNTLERYTRQICIYEVLGPKDKINELVKNGQVSYKEVKKNDVLQSIWRDYLPYEFDLEFPNVINTEDLNTEQLQKLLCD